MRAAPPPACPREGEIEGREGGLSAASLMSWTHVSEEVTVLCKTSIWQAVQVSTAIGLVVLVVQVECGFCIGTLVRVNRMCRLRPFPVQMRACKVEAVVCVCPVVIIVAFENFETPHKRP